VRWVRNSLTASVGTAARNASAVGVADRCAWRVSDWLAALSGTGADADASADAAAVRPPDVITANPPYVTTAAWETLPATVRVYEPRRALDGGPDGLDAYRALAAQAPAHMSPATTLVVEIGAHQGDAVRHLMGQQGLRCVAARHDLADWERCLAFRLH
jgi:release factor glutamine methyltransferase